MNELSTERAIEALYTIRAYYASLTAGYPKGKDRRGIGDVMCSEIANSCLMAIKALEQAKWIPVSERLPELYTFVYATCHSLVDDRENWVIETCYVPIPKEYNSRKFSDWGNIPMLNHGEAEVIAWMERDIPEPYKAESENKA